MNPEKAAAAARFVPKKRQRHHSYDESVDEPAKLLEQEAVEIEEEIPLDDSEASKGPSRRIASCPHSRNDTGHLAGRQIARNSPT
jgi:hypothetical protein